MTPRDSLKPLATAYTRDRFARREIGIDRRRALDLWLRSFTDSFGDRPPSQLGRSAVERWMESIAHHEASTRRLAFNAVRLFLDWLVFEGHIPVNPARQMKAPTEPERLPRGCRREEAHAVIAILPDTRAEVILALEYGMGLRRCEVARAMVGDYDERRLTLKVHGKKGKERVMAVPQPVADILDRYLREQGHRAGPLLRSKREPWKGLAPHTIGLLVADWQRQADVKRPGIAGHAYRHAFAAELLDECEDIRVAQEALGHSNAATTSIYAGVAPGAKVRAAMEARVSVRPPPAQAA